MNDQKKDESAKEKISSALDNLKEHEQVKKVQSFAKEHKADTAAYIILFVGIIIALFSPLYGGAIVGAVVGIYFADDVVNTLGNLKGFIKEKGKLKSLILLGLMIVFFIALPALFIVAAAAVGIKQLVSPTKPN